MKKYILLVVLSFSFFISNSQDEKVDLGESYILTKKGEKIPIVPNEEITLKRNNITYCSSKVFKKIRFLKKDVEKKIPIKTYKYKYKDLSIKRIARIVDQDKLYLPLKNIKEDIIFREVLKNENYTLGYYHVFYTAGVGNSASVVNLYKFIIIDNKTQEIVKRGNIDIDTKGDVNINDDVINKYFKKCLNQEQLAFLEHYEPYKMFLKGEKSTEKKVKEWYKFIRGSFINMGYLSTSYLSFLPEYNQYECD